MFDFLYRLIVYEASKFTAELYSSVKCVEKETKKGLKVKRFGPDGGESSSVSETFIVIVLVPGLELLSEAFRQTQECF